MPAKRSGSFVDALIISSLMVGAIYLIEVFTLVTKIPLQNFGIVPRTVAGLPGIIFTPLLHANMAHVMANSAPLFVLMVLLFSNPEYHPPQTLSSIWLASGCGTWLIGRGNAVHIGASSVVFGLAAFLIVAGLRVKSWKSVFVAVLVFLLYGGIFYGALPQAGPISWEGHLSGAIVGAWLARKW